MKKLAPHLDAQFEKEKIQMHTHARTAAFQRGETALQASASKNLYGHLVKIHTPLQLQRHAEKIADSERNPSYAPGSSHIPEARQSADKAPEHTSILVIKAFLLSCDPPMNHLLPLFMKAGCVSGDCLQPIAKRSPEQREGILRRILELPPASRRQTHDHNDVAASNSARDIDIWLLDLHLASYAFEVE